MEGFIASCGKESSSSVMSASKEPHFDHGRTHISDFDRSIVAANAGVAKPSETRSLGQDMSDLEGTSVKGSGRVACAQEGQGVSEGCV